MKITKLQKNYHRYEILSDGLKYEQPIYFTSDWHFDNQKTDEKAIKFLFKLQPLLIYTNIKIPIFKNKRKNKNI